MQGFQDKVAFIWAVADLLRGDYKQSEYGRVILPFTVLRRLDCVLEPNKQAVLDAAQKHAGSPEAVRDKMLLRAAGTNFYNQHKLDFRRLLDDPNNIAHNLTSYIHAFSPNARDILEHFRFEKEIAHLDKNDLLYLVVQKFCEIDLHPDVVSGMQMGYIFEELIRKFSEQSNETAGEHFTPREVIRLMVNLLFIEDADLLTKELALARSEMRENLAQTRRGAMAVSAGGVVLVGGYIVLLLAAVYALSLVVAPWAAALIVGGIAAIAGYAMVKSGSRQFSAHDLKPERTIDSIHKDADAIRRARHEYH